MIAANAAFKREVWAWARHAGNADLVDRVDVLDSLYLDADELPNIEVERNRDRYEILKSELDRRKRVAVQGGPSPNEKRYEDWRLLATDIRHRVDLPELFDRLGYSLRRAGTNSRRGCDEYSGSCPVCGGTDRLRVWAGPDGLAWCRQCGWSADAIVVAQSLDRSLDRFYAAVRFLAEFCGLQTPNEAFPKSVDVGHGVMFHPLPSKRRG